MTTPSAHAGQLKRSVGFWGLMFVSLGSIIGSGWLLGALNAAEDRKSTRLNSSHSQISYAVFCLKKKKTSLRPRTFVVALWGAVMPIPAVDATPLCISDSWKRYFIIPATATINPKKS